MSGTRRPHEIFKKHFCTMLEGFSLGSGDHYPKRLYYFVYLGELAIILQWCACVLLLTNAAIRTIKNNENNDMRIYLWNIFYFNIYIYTYAYITYIYIYTYFLFIHCFSQRYEAVLNFLRLPGEFFGPSLAVFCCSDCGGRPLGALETPARPCFFFFFWGEILVL